MKKIVAMGLRESARTILTDSIFKELKAFGDTNLRLVIFGKGHVRRCFLQLLHSLFGDDFLCGEDSKIRIVGFANTDFLFSPSDGIDLREDLSTTRQEESGPAMNCVFDYRPFFVDLHKNRVWYDGRDARLVVVDVSASSNLPNLYLPVLRQIPNSCVVTANEFTANLKGEDYGPEILRLGLECVGLKQRGQGHMPEANVTAKILFWDMLKALGLMDSSGTARFFLNEKAFQSPAGFQYKRPLAF
jgi:hypothetical protein